MIKNFIDLARAGYVNRESGGVLRPLDFQAITGKESGVKKEQTIENSMFFNSEVVCRVENYNGKKMYETYNADELKGIKVNAFCASFNVKFFQFFDRGDIKKCASWGATAGELSNISDPETRGNCFYFSIDEGRETRFIWIFCPETWE